MSTVFFKLELYTEIHGCPGNTSSKKGGKKVNYFRALEEQLETWTRAIPGNKPVQLHDKICSRHFEDRDLTKEWNFVINNQTVTMPRARMALKVGAVPCIFDNYEGEAPAKRKSRKARPASSMGYETTSDDNTERGPSSKRLKSRKRESPTRNRPRKNVKRPSKHVKGGSKSFSRKNSRESVSNAAEVVWENDCDEFVNQLNTLRSAPSDKQNAKPALRNRPSKRVVTKKCRADLSENQEVPETSLRLQEPSLPRSDRKSANSSGENSVIVEQFVLSGSEVTGSHSGCDPLEGSPRRRRKPNRSINSNSEDVVVIMNDPHSPPVISIPPEITVKTENCEGHEDGVSAEVFQEEHLNLTSESKGYCGINNKWDFNEVQVKRELCDCEGTSSQCCAPVRSDITILDLPITPAPCDDIQQPPEDTHVFYEPFIVSEKEKPSERVKDTTPVIQPTTQGSNVDHVRSDYNITHPIDASPEQMLKNFTSTVIPEKPDSPKPIEKMPQTSNEIENDFDSEMDFQGFSSGDEEEAGLRKNVFQDSIGLAIRSPKSHFDKLNEVPNCEITKQILEDVSPQNHLRASCKATWSEDNPKDGLNKLNTVTCWSKKSKDENRSPSEDAASITEQSLLSNEKSPTQRDLVHEDVVLEPKVGGPISNEVTVTKSSDSVGQLDKVSPNVHNFDKVLPSTITTGPPLVQTSSAMPDPSKFQVKDKLIHPATTSKKMWTPSNSLVNMIPKPPPKKLAHLLNGSSLDRILQSTKATSLHGTSSTPICDPTIDKTSLILKNFKSDGVLALEVVVLKEQVRQLQKELFLHKQMLLDSEHNASLLQRRLELQSQLPCTKCMNSKNEFVRKETFI